MNVPSRELMPVIRAALERGQRVRLTVTGRSMEPFIYDGDVVELESMRSRPSFGDMILVCHLEDCYVLHRVVKIDGDEFFLRGDSQRDSEGPFTQRDVLGKAIVSYHRGRVRVFDCGAWRLAILIWMRCAPWSLWLLRPAGRIWRSGRVALRRLQQWRHDIGER